MPPAKPTPPPSLDASTVAVTLVIVAVVLGTMVFGLAAAAPELAG